MSEWRSIESAPRDGTRVLICRVLGMEQDVVTAQYVVTHSDVCEPHWLTSQENDYEYADYAVLRECPSEWIATHWMPLPSPPETQR